MKMWLMTDEQRERLLEEARRSVNLECDEEVYRQYAILRGRVQGMLENLTEVKEEDKE